MLHKLKEVAGTPTLLFLHGFMGNHTDWQRVASHLPCTCLALNLPGHAGTPFTPDFASFLLQWIERPLHLIGYSMGGRLALQFAARYPDKIASLTLISSHLGLKTGHAERLAKDQALAKEILSRSIDELLQIWYDQPIFQSLQSKMDVRSMRREQNREHLSLALEAFSLGHQPDLSRIPARLIVGELDEKYRAHYADLPHTIIPDAGHAAHLENPQAVAGAIYDHFR